MIATAAEIIAALEAESDPWLVATKSFTMHVDGERREVRAGVTGVVVGHPLALARPDAFAPEPADSRRSRAAGRHSTYRMGPAPTLTTKRATAVARKRQPTATSAPKPSRSAAWREQAPALGSTVELRENGPAVCTVTLAGTARDDILSDLARGGALETGGILMGPAHFSWHPSLRVNAAYGPGNLARRKQGSLGPDDFHDDECERKHRAVFSGEVRVGYWHCHPYPVEEGGDLPSGNDGDLKVVEAMARAAGTQHFLSLIVTPDAERGWDRPAFHPWILRLDATLSGRSVCERGVLA